MNFSNALVSHPAEVNAAEMLQGSRQAGNQQQELVLRSAALEATANAVLITTRNGAIHWVNPAFERLTGYALDEIRGRNPSFLQSGEMEPAFYKSMWDTIVGGDVWQGELLNRHKDGSKYTENMTITPVADSAGEISHFIAVKEDISERTSMEARYRSLFEAAKDAIFISTQEGRFLDVNPACSELLGYSREELLRLDRSRILWCPADREDLLQTLRRDGFIRDFEIHLRHRAGHRLTVLETAFVERAPSGTESVTYWSILRDVTDHRALQARLQQAQKMEAVGQLAGGIAHDFNNLLTAINGFAELGLEEVDAEGSLIEYFEEIHGAGIRAATLTRQLLAFSRRQVLQPRIVDLNALITDFESLVQRTLGEEVEVILALDIDDCLVRADPVQVEQIVMNLAVNARDAMAEGGQLTLTTSRVELTQGNVTVSGVAPGRYVSLEVADTGTGISEEVLAHIFEPFFTTKELERGTGLGLSTVYGIVQQSGGQIKVKSVVGKGTSFVIYLPLAPLADDLHESGSGSRSMQAGDETILVVEDESTVRALVRRSLEKIEYRVLEATSGREAVELLADGENNVDLVLTDLIMPQMRGTELRRILMETHPGLPFVFMSGYMDQALIQSGVPDGVPFVAKPFSRESLAEAIRQGLL